LRAAIGCAFALAACTSSSSSSPSPSGKPPGDPAKKPPAAKTQTGPTAGATGAPHTEYRGEWGDRALTARIEPRGSGVSYALTASGPGCDGRVQGVAAEKQGDLESRDDEAGTAHFVHEYDHETDACSVSISIDREDRSLAWVQAWDCPALAACAIDPDRPLTRVNAASAPSPTSFTNPAFQSFAAKFPPLALPATLPLDPAVGVAIEQRPVERSLYQTYVCGTGFFDCLARERGNVFYRGFRLDLSPQAIALLYRGVGKRDDQLVLMTYDGAGKPKAGLIVAGELDDRAYGFDAEIAADSGVVKITRSRYVPAGDEKEYVKQQTFRVTAAGDIEELVE
jgi:hypothetical protein